MAVNTGYKQAVIAYKYDKQTGWPVDVDGRRTSESGKRQAILLLEGWANPNPTLYEVQAYFPESAVIDGQNTSVWAPEDCPEGQRVPWVLDGGVWNMSHFWINNELWTSI